ncbi:unnamed protein product [Haemonchus placei]|uniref:MSC domain-containing protein n=1 Tax=Haemonchus placei TaxID=6290 RepID=A0A0N4W5V8_HAEPC|nr:unnamed protein product [Haemonchus placei]
MDQQLREIEGLLETSAHPDSEDLPTKIKKYVKLVLPHVALVAVVCLYAVIGAYIFYRLESPNEDRLKSVGKALIGDMRNNLIAMIRDGRGSKEVWKDSIEGELYRFNDKIYKAFKEQYVRYADVRITPNQELSLRVDDSDRPKRHRATRSRFPWASHPIASYIELFVARGHTVLEHPCEAELELFVELFRSLSF